MKTYEKFRKSLTEEQKKVAEKTFNEIYAPYKDQKPIICISRHKDDYKHVKKIKL